MSETAGFAESFECAAELHSVLLRRAHATDRDSPAQVLNLAAAVVLHGLLERAAVLGTARFVSEDLRDSLENEHASLRGAIDLMEELATNPADADDLQALGRAVHDEILQHVERDNRVIYESLARLDAFAPADPG